MKITDIGTYKGDTMYIDTDDGQKIFLASSIVYKFNLEKNMEIPSSALEQVQSENLFRKARERALYLLDNREYGYVELFKKLENNYDDDICYRVCNDLAKSGLINDRRYAAHLAEYYGVRKKYGRYRTRQELMRRGLSAELSDSAAERFADGETDRLREVVERKYERYLTDRKGVQKVKSALVRLGYSFSEINEVLAEYTDS